MQAHVETSIASRPVTVARTRLVSALGTWVPAALLVALAGATGAKVLDAQAGAESAFSILAQGLGSLNLIHNVGYMDDGMVCSPAQLVLGNENIGMTKRFVRGIEISQETLAREVIENVGPGGHFLAETHTLNHFKGEFWRPGLMARGDRETWIEQGSRDTLAVIQEKLKDIIENHQVPELPGSALESFARIKAKGEKLLT